MNKHGTPTNLIRSHPGNTNAARHGIHSPRLIQSKASEIEVQLSQSFDFTAVERLALHEVARCMAILDAIDRDLDERGIVNKRGNPTYLLDLRFRTSRQLERWLARISETMERQRGDQEPPSVGRDVYIRELNRIALGRDSTASSHDRLSALKELVRLEENGEGGKAPQAAVTVIFKDGDYEPILEAEDSAQGSQD